MDVENIDKNFFRTIFNAFALLIYNKNYIVITTFLVKKISFLNLLVCKNQMCSKNQFR